LGDKTKGLLGGEGVQKKTPVVDADFEHSYQVDEFRCEDFKAGS